MPYIRTLSSSLGDKQVFFGVLTDRLVFEAYLLQDAGLSKIEEVNLEGLSADDAFIWFGTFLFSEKALIPSSQDAVKRFGDTIPRL